MGDLFWSELAVEMSGYIPSTEVAEGSWRTSHNATSQLRDARTGERVVFAGFGDYVGIFVHRPTDPVAESRLNIVIESQPEGVWSLPNTSWRASWPSDADQAVRERVSNSVATVMRDGLEMDPAALRLSVWDNDGPGKAPRSTVVTGRPTDRGAPEKCSEWDDFADRLEWGLTTLPQDAFLVLSTHASDAARGYVSMERFRGHMFSRVGLYNRVGGSADDLIVDAKRRISTIEWAVDPLPSGDGETTGWVGQDMWNSFGLRSDAVPRIITTLRDGFGVANPRELHLRGTTSETSYLARELGVDDADKYITSPRLTGGMCNDWNDFQDRLDLVLQALPVLSTVHLWVITIEGQPFLSQTVYRASSERYNFAVTPIGCNSEQIDLLATFFSEINYTRTERGVWVAYSPESEILAGRITWLFRDILRVPLPKLVWCRAFRNQPQDDLPQLCRDLGLERYARQGPVGSSPRERE